MKKILLLLLLSQVILAQENNYSNYTKKNEIKINASYLVSGGAEVSYDYILNDESSIGISGSFAYDNDTDLRNALTINYRFYFGKKYAAGFFAETFGMLNTQKNEEFVVSGLFSGFYEDEIKTNFGLGFAIGGKFITKRGLLLEIYGGVGRNIGASDGFETVPRVGISVGKRF